MFVTAESVRVSGPRLMLILCVLLGLLGQLALTAAAMPGEMPRATLERLTGLVVTSAVPMDMSDSIGNSVPEHVRARHMSRNDPHPVSSPDDMKPAMSQDDMKTVMSH